MRNLFIVLLLLGPAGNAGAHTLASKHGLLAQLGHQIAGPYHLGITLALSIVAIGCLKGFARRRK